jgi:glycosyltransferase involved in cell wall biosynthesis
MSARPRISVAAPSYNRLDYLPQAIESGLAQTIDRWELVFVGDGS